MPLLVHCSELQPGMKLAHAFLFKGRMMLPGGKTLTPEDVDVLHRKYPEVMLQVGDPLLDSVAEFEDDAKERAVAQTAQSQVTQTLSKVQERFSSRAAIASLDFNAMRNAASSVLEFLKANPVSAALLSRSEDKANYLSDHSAAVFYLCLVLGSAVRDYVVRERMRQTAATNLSANIAMDLLPLGLGAMFMDVGMYPLKHLYEEGYQLTDEDRQAIRQHPNAGADNLPDTLPAGVKMVVRTHHENVDGSGYPLGLKGDSQHIFTRIVRICDAFEAGTAQRVYSAAKSPARVIWEMSAGPFKRCYDPVLLKVFRGLIQPFPIGAKLRLADGRYAVVVRYNRNQPFAPTCIVAFDEHNERLDLEHMVGPSNVGEGNDLRIASFNTEDLSFIYDMPPESAEPATPKAVADLFAAAYP